MVEQTPRNQDADSSDSIKGLAEAFARGATRKRPQSLQ